jgi:sigma-E factor negative regulatory protein RseC
MIEQQGQVIAVSGDLVSVRLGGSSGCPACDAGKGCGAGIFGRMLQRKPAVLELENTLDVSAGQAVVVGLPESLFLRFVFHLYLTPLLAGLAGAALGHYFSIRAGAGPAVADGWSLFGAITAALLALGWSRKRSREFPNAIAVHLLRGADPANSNQCHGADRGEESR